MAILSVLPDRIIFRFRLKNLLRINILYFIALLDLLFAEFLVKKSVKVKQAGLLSLRK
jgi:hypothetical protein